MCPRPLELNTLGGFETCKIPCLVATFFGAAHKCDNTAKYQFPCSAKFEATISNSQMRFFDRLSEFPNLCFKNGTGVLQHYLLQSSIKFNPVNNQCSNSCHYLTQNIKTPLHTLIDFYDVLSRSVFFVLRNVFGVLLFVCESCLPWQNKCLFFWLPLLSRCTFSHTKGLVYAKRAFGGACKNVRCVFVIVILRFMKTKPPRTFDLKCMSRFDPLIDVCIMLCLSFIVHHFVVPVNTCLFDVYLVCLSVSLPTLKYLKHLMCFRVCFVFACLFSSISMSNVYVYPFLRPLLIHLC